MKHKNSKPRNPDKSRRFFSRKTINTLKIIVTTILVVLILQKAGLDNIYRAFSVAGPGVFALGLFIYAIYFFINVILFKSLIMWGGGPVIKKGALLLDFTRAAVLAMFTPARSGQFLMIKFLSDRGLESGQAWAVYLVYKLLNYTVLFSLALLGAIFLISEVGYTIAIAGLIVIAAAFTLFLFSETPRNWIKKKFESKIQGKFKGFSKSLELFKSKKLQLGYALILKFVIRASMAMIIYLFIYTQGSSAGFIEVLLLSVIASVIAMVPVSIGGFGIREGSAVLLFSMVGVEPAVTVAAYLFYYVVGIVSKALILIFFTKKYGL
ncbi:MAG: lysylphosphatidylglycerol synthase transmembrane domain-containing protein [Elusimicrobiota bacterium]